MEIPDPFLPGAISLLDQLDKRLMVMLRDGKTLIGDLRTIDQFANLVLQNTLERIYVDKCYGDIPRGMFMIRGENVILAGELGNENPPELKRVSLEEILRMQRDKHEQREKRDQAKKQMMSGRGHLKADIFGDHHHLIDVQIPRRKIFVFNLSIFRASVPLSGLRCPRRRIVSAFVPSKMSDVKIHNVVFVLGPPGSGKGTQCEKIREKFGFVHLSAGELLRDEMNRTGSDTGASIRKHMTDGTIVPVAITCKLIEDAMLAAGDAPGFLIDGFPRNQDNLDGWKKEMDGKVREHFVLFLQAPFDICLSRCLARAGNRPDDNAEAYEKRILTYNTQTLAIVDYYRRYGKVRDVDSTPDMETVSFGF
ncbi:Like-Sm ribonucleoprotein and Adenylate kinase domain containing protein [Aphelenchoides besseyi]|nr:Like-Sm ribonucleoprotein and Adenylate kinase domain containing protein [Aphelenchoides besseyi]